MSLLSHSASEYGDELSGEELLLAISTPRSVREYPLRTERLNIAYVADALHRYPGEALTFFIRVQVAEALAGLNLEVHMPRVLQIGDAHCLSGNVSSLPGVFPKSERTILSWTIDGDIDEGTEFEFCVESRVKFLEEDDVAVSRAVVRARSKAHDDQIEDEEEVAVRITTQARYLRYLPAIYTHDRLMGRFLMLFESFWGPVDQQIAGIDHYFDPTVTPEDFLPWLLSWIALPSEEDDAEGEKATRMRASVRDPLTLPSSSERARHMLQVSQQIHKRRGTRRGLQQYLKIYTGTEVQVIEHRAENFVLGPKGRLGSRIALGRENHPHTFTVVIRFPVARARLEQMGEAMLAQRKEAVRHRVVPIIDEQKPAQTTYTLHIEVDPV